MQKRKKMVLLVDDSHLIIERLSDMLNEAEHIGEVLHALSGNEALETLQKRMPDIVLLDINLPDISGVELLRIIKEKYPGIIVIMLTNQANDYYRNLCLNIGANHFADKSADFESIPHIIESFQE